jgi:hypothetical protein
MTTEASDPSRSRRRRPVAPARLVALLLLCACGAPQAASSMTIDLPAGPPAPVEPAEQPRELPDAGGATRARSDPPTHLRAPAGWRTQFVYVWNTMAECIAHDGATPACPPVLPMRMRLPDKSRRPDPFTYGPPPPGNTTACCPPLRDHTWPPGFVPTGLAAAPAATQPPQVCEHTGVPRCDEYVASLRDYAKSGGSWEGAQEILGQGCDAWRTSVKENGMEWTQHACVTALLCLDNLRQAKPAP